jgi:hypothetical protein
MLECRHAAEQPVVQEMRTAPFHGFVNIRAGGVDKLAEVVEDGLGKIGRAGDIRVHADVSFHFLGHTFAPKVTVSTGFDKPKAGWFRIETRSAAFFLVYISQWLCRLSSA